MTSYTNQKNSSYLLTNQRNARVTSAIKKEISILTLRVIIMLILILKIVSCSNILISLRPTLIPLIISIGLLSIDLCFRFI